MSRVLLAAVLLGALSVQAAEAKTLEDVLKEKGVITEEDYKEVTKSKPLKYTLGKGFTFTSQDEKFQLSLGGRLQTRFTYIDTDQKTGADSDKWEIKRMKVWLAGYAYTKDLSYLLQLEFANNTSVNRLIEHAYLDYHLTDEVQLLVGQTKVPFGRQWLNSSGNLELVDRSVVSDVFRPGYDTGVKLHGDILKGILTYDAGVYGGAGQTTARNSSTDYATAARLTVNPFGKMPYSEADLDQSEKPLVSVGFDYYGNTLAKTGTATLESNAVTLALNSSSTTGTNGWLGRATTSNAVFGTEHINFDLVGADFAFKWLGLFAEGEYIVANAEGQTSKRTLHGDGFFAEAGYCIIPKTFEAAIRYSYLDPSRAVTNDHQIDVTGGLSWYFSKHNLKVQSDITNSHIQHATGPTDDMIYRVQAQVIF